MESRQGPIHELVMLRAAALFPEKRKRKPAADVKDAIRKYIRKRHARG
jgi:hypothetical protein